jgi:sporulation protein YlmC with PRC-barrel domain
MAKQRLMGVLLAVSLAAASQAGFAQVAGGATLGVTVEQQELVINGWSVKKTIIGKKVLNENGDTVGTIDDIIIAPEGSVSYAIIGAGHFLHVARHDVAIPVSQIDVNDNGQFVLAGATRDALKQLPVFEYAKVKNKPVSRKEAEHH